MDDADDIDPTGHLTAMLLAAEAAADGGDPDAAHKIAALADGGEDDEPQDTDLHDPAEDYGADDQ